MVALLILIRILKNIPLQPCQVIVSRALSFYNFMLKGVALESLLVYTSCSSFPYIHDTLFHNHLSDEKYEHVHYEALIVLRIF